VAGVGRIYYAALGADIPDLRYPAPDALSGVHTEHVPVDGAAEPFTRYLAGA
jgi:hypothetical protein